jgi:hypothetical protein
MQGSTGFPGRHRRPRVRRLVKATTEAAAPETTETATAASDPVADTPIHGYEPTREAAMAAGGVVQRRANAGRAGGSCRLSRTGGAR